MPLTASPSSSANMPAIFPTDFPRVIESGYECAASTSDGTVPPSRPLSFVFATSPRVIEDEYLLE